MCRKNLTLICLQKFVIKMWPGFDRCSSRTENQSQQETLAEVEHISTIAGSLGSIGTTLSQCGNEPVYDTDHTDLNSDYDEAELRRELLKDFDPEGFGEIPIEDFIVALKSPELQAQVPLNKRELLYERAMKLKLPKGPGSISFQDFVNIMSGKRTRSFKCAVHHRDREVCSENDFHLMLEEPPFFKKMVHTIALEILPEERDRKYYADKYSCCPPPYFMILITCLELGFFTYHTLTFGQANPAGPIPIDSMFIFRPDKRHEFWRFLFYMILHAGWFHLGFNLCIQLLVGLPLEMVHGSGRIACVYFSGVLAGSLGTSVFDPEVYLVGASGGVYALLAAHLANVMLNYSSMRYGILRLAAIFIIASCDVGFAIYARYANESPLSPSISYVAHLTGALDGLTIGLLVLKNFEQKLHEQLLWWIALGIYTACIIFSIVFNVINSVTGQRLEEETKIIKEHIFHDVGI